MATEARQKAQAKYNSKPEQIKKRASRNKARRQMIAAGRAHKGDGKDVAHKNNNALDDRMDNYVLQSQAKNRSFKRDSKARRAKG